MHKKVNLTQAKKSGKFNFLISLSSHIATPTSIKFMHKKANLTQAKKSGKFNFLFSLSSHIATSTSVFLIAYICKSIVNMSFKPNNVVKKESDNSDDVIFMKQEFGLTQIPSSTYYETSVTHVSESKYFK